MIFNEINFLRELKFCENIVQLEYVYSGRDVATGIRSINCVLKFAKCGPIIKLLHGMKRLEE
jgi:hypothetical protein